MSYNLSLFSVFFASCRFDYLFVFVAILGIWYSQWRVVYEILKYKILIETPFMVFFGRHPSTIIWGLNENPLRASTSLNWKRKVECELLAKSYYSVSEFLSDEFIFVAWVIFVCFFRLLLYMLCHVLWD